MGNKNHTFSRLSSVKTWLSGLERQKDHKEPRAPEWDIKVVVAALAKPRFEPIETISLKHLTMKTAFLVAITSARRVSEIHALDERSLRFTPSSVSIDTLPSFRHKVDSAFHANCRIALPAHQPGLDDLPVEIDVARALREYRKRTQKLRVAKQQHNPLFLCHDKKHARGKPASKQTIARWLQDTINLAYKLMGVAPEDCPQAVKAHSTRKVATSVAFEQGVDVETICQAATWKTHKTFFNFYKLDVDRREDALFGLSVLRSATTNIRKKYDLLVPRPLPSTHPPRQVRFVPPWEIAASHSQGAPSTSQAPSRLTQSTLPPEYHPHGCTCPIHKSRRK
ncbi:MAG: tyrosine-type recombinase/integrase [Gammaproteobacteria bacterium]|nr:tyrosine-type recombinase/integrase [Gammaproteobacteria bacterium]